MRYALDDGISGLVSAKRKIVIGSLKMGKVVFRLPFGVWCFCCACLQVMRCALAIRLAVWFMRNLKYIVCRQPENGKMIFRLPAYSETYIKTTSRFSIHIIHSPNRHSPRSLTKYCTRISWLCVGSWGRLWQAKPAAMVCGFRLRGQADRVQS